MNHFPYSYFTSYQSPLGRIFLYEKENRLVSISWNKFPCENTMEKTTSVLAETVQQLKEYFCGRRRIFSIPLFLEGTDFQKSVWQKLQEIPFGETLSYEAVAQDIKRPKACRAVGLANGKNKIPIIIPCHRVINKSGTLAGFSVGIDKKQFLLRLEKQGQ